MLQKTVPEIDICFLDFDGCLYPGISKVQVAFEITRSVLLAPRKISDRRFLPSLGFAGACLVLMRLRQKLFGQISDGDLVEVYQRLLSHLPEVNFRAAAERIPARLVPQGIDTAAWLAARWPTGIISLALSPVLEAVDTALHETTGQQLDFAYGNSIAGLGDFQAGQVLSGTDKVRIMRAELEKRDCRCPLVIGNDLEDLEMVQLCREMGGISIGINPRKGLSEHFDFVVSGASWQPVLDLLKDLFEPSFPER